MKNYKEWIAKYEVMKDYDMESFIKMRILIAHTGINHNGSKFTLESFEAAKPTLANKPLLARVVEVGENQYDFNGHDMDWDIDENGNFKVTYLEQPIGVIPESHDYEIVEFDGREYVAATGYVWRGYTNLAEQIIDERGVVDVSMEIDFGEEDYRYNEQEGCYEINKFRYKGVTLLGAHVCAGMEKAHATALFTRKSDEEITTEYTRMVEKLKEELETMFTSNEEQPQVVEEVIEEVVETVEEAEEVIAVEETNIWEEAFKSVFNVESLEQFDVNSFKIIAVEEYENAQAKFDEQLAELQATIQQLKQEAETMQAQIVELSEYKAQREQQDVEIQREEIIEEYTALIGKSETTAIAEQFEDLQKLEFALALAFKDKAKNAAPRVKGVKIKNENLFSRSEENSKPKRKLAL